MHKYIKWTPTVLLLLVFGGFLTACNKQLDQTPSTSLTDASFWKSASDLKLAANYFYSYLPGLGGDAATGQATPYQDNYSEIAYNRTGGNNSISDGSRVAPATVGEWTNYYKLIRACNNLLEHARLINDPANTDLINQYMGEAYFFRALGYFNLVKRFGDVPYLDRTAGMEDSLIYSGRVQRDIVIDSVLNDLDNAAAFCPSPVDQSTADYGRITSTAALAYKSRVALFEGTWNKFHGGGDFVRDLTLAKDAANKVMESGMYHLFTYTAIPDSSYYYLFQYQDASSQTSWTYANNKEIILPRIYGTSMQNKLQTHSFVRGSATDGAVSATRQLVDLYLYQDGLPNGKSSYDSSMQETSSNTAFRHRDSRFGMTYFKLGDPYPSINGLIPYTGKTTYTIKKYNTINDFATSTSFISFYVIRYAEVLLNYAEATYELSGSISDGDLNKSINLLRKRANMPDLTGSFVSSNGLNMQTEIRRERTIELCFEGFHYWDILRWKTAEDVLPKTLLGPKYFASEMTGVTNPKLDANGFIILEAAPPRKFDAKRDYLWPLPTKEIGIINDPAKYWQNPGWQ